MVYIMYNCTYVSRTNQSNTVESPNKGCVGGQHKFSYSPLFQNHRENMFWGPLAVSSIERFMILWYPYYEGSLINQSSNEAVYTHCCLCPAYTYEPLSSGEVSG